MRPINNLSLSESGETESRIGPYRRKLPYSQLSRIEKLIISGCPLEASADVNPIQPPYFTEFNYTDLLGGMSLRTFSAEINARLSRIAMHDPVDESVYRMFMDSLDDKYALKPISKTYETVVFLCGHNLIDRVLDSQKLFSFMDANPEAVIKPHPLTSDGLLRNLGIYFGYHRIIDKDESGFSLLKACRTVVGLPTSELSILAILFEKKYIDISQYINNWMGVAAPYLHAALSEPTKIRDRLLSTLLSPRSGFILKDMSDEVAMERIRIYTDLAMREREKFKMITSQRLGLSTPAIFNARQE